MAAIVPVEVPVVLPNSSLSPETLKKLILEEQKTPVLLRGFIEQSWLEPLTWSPQVISQKLRNVRTKFKSCPKVGTIEHEQILSQTDVVFETHCDYVDATFGEFAEWLESVEHCEAENEPQSKRVHHDTGNTAVEQKQGPFSSLSQDTHWIYADYKYMNELCCDHLDLIKAIDWSVFGFESRNGNQSTLWVGSEGACTPCHYDTYGCNLVAQLWGRKEWTLFSPVDSDKLYPTRVPYEESSVFSQVNIKTPQTTKYNKFLNAIPYKVTLCPGDVLFVPYHWWHYVECLEQSVSVNTWIELGQDAEDKLKEAIVRILVSNFVTPDNELSLVNPNEIIFPVEDNMHLLSMMLNKNEEQLLTVTDFINVLTSDQVLKILVDTVKHKYQSLCALSVHK